HELERLRSGALAALGRMATQVAHELKNPLAGLRLYARHLEQRLLKTGDGEGAALAQKISSTVDHLAAVVSEITAFGRPPELHRAPVAVHSLLDECVSFADTGVGMADETLARIFDLFFTTKPQGTGLGMAIARSVIDLHGGELTVHSVVGQGSRVVARLPLEAAPAREGTAS